MTSWPLIISTLVSCCGFGTLFFVGLGEARGFGRKARIPALAVVLVVLLAALAIISVALGSASAVVTLLRGVARLSNFSLSVLMILLGIVVAVIYIAMAARETPKVARLVVAALAMIIGLSGAWVAGNQFVLANKSAWNTWLLPASYLLNALVIGGTLVSSIAALRGTTAKALREPLVITIVLTALDTVALIGWAAHTGWTVDPAIFWGGAVIVGCITSLLLDVVALKVPRIVIAAFLCSAVGGMCLRIAMKLLDSNFIAVVHTSTAGVHGWGF